jgi:xanthine dehydrogenase small subunit
MAGHIEFVLNGEIVRVDNPDPNCTVLDYLRDHCRLTGTKEGCREGDCGACTATQVLLVDNAPQARAINTCIQFMPTLHGTALFTVEGVAGANGDLHPIQAAMVECHASQCGFCTPGFVMSLHSADLAGEIPQKARIVELLTGNLCRCTGYGPILAAAEQSLGAHGDKGNLLATTAERIRAIDTAEMLSIEYESPQSSSKRTYDAPRSLAELAEVLAAYPDATILAGGTDLGLQVTKQYRKLNNLVDVNRVAELRKIKIDESGIAIGAAVTYTQARKDLAGQFPAMGSFLSRIASEQIRNTGTIGGNIANGSPIGDMPPALIALNSRIELVGPAGKRELPLEDFFIAYGKQDRRNGEIISRILIPHLADSAQFEAYKISKRFDQDISSVCGAFHAVMKDGVLSNVRIAFGGMAGTPKRASVAEAGLEGRQLDAVTVDAAVAGLAKDFTPLSDHRASAEYRMLVAANLLRKFCASLTGAQPPRLDRPVLA